VADDPHLIAQDIADRLLMSAGITTNGFLANASSVCLLDRIGTASTVAALEDTVSQELLGPLCVRGQRMVVGGHTGAGKSTFSLALAKAVTEESELLGWRGAGGRALVVDLEQGLRTIKRRLAESGLSGSESVDIMRVPEGLALDRNQRERDELGSILADGGYSLVVVDPLYKAHAGDSNDERAMVGLMGVLDAWRAEYGFCLAIPMHMRKPPPQGGTLTMHDIFGSSGLVRGAEVVVGLERLSPGMSRLHFWKDRDGDLPVGEKWMLTFERERGFERATQKEKAVDAIGHLVSARPGLTSTEIADETGFAKRTVMAALSQLRAVGETTGNRNERRWSMPPSEEDEEHYERLASA
jgi:energy-coupling factor transporter ATP-binding protein EcfA2